jgi:hypothetical protein
METVRTQLNNCALEINWRAPQDGGSWITGYTIEVLGTSGEFYPVESCG